MARKINFGCKGTTKNVYVQEKCVFIAIGHIFLVSLLLFIFVAIEMAYFCLKYTFLQLKRPFSAIYLHISFFFRTFAG